MNLKIKNFVILEHGEIKDAINVINKNGGQICLVINDNY